jgi:SAM-dependent methyltransferase
MSGFSAEWLALREPVDHRSRDRALATELARHLASNAEPSIVDLGCGTGSNLRATAPLLGPRQRWTLVDYDPHLLDEARDRLSAWADEAQMDGSTLTLARSGKLLAVTFRQADLSADLEHALGGACDLVTASALFDLCSPAFIAHFAEVLAGRGTCFYTTLTYDGVQTWSPSHPADDAMRRAFLAHQKTDKGLGAAAGADAPDELKTSLRAAGFRVQEGLSPWRLGASDTRLIAELATGFADAVSETSVVAQDVVRDWLKVSREAAVVGHRDTLAILPA